MQCVTVISGYISMAVNALLRTPDTLTTRSTLLTWRFRKMKVDNFVFELTNPFSLKPLCAYIVLSGDTSVFQGIDERMPNELTASAYDTDAVRHTPERKCSVWIGSSGLHDARNFAYRSVDSCPSPLLHLIVKALSGEERYQKAIKSYFFLSTLRETERTWRELSSLTPRQSELPWGWESLLGSLVCLWSSHRCGRVVSWDPKAVVFDHRCGRVAMLGLKRLDKRVPIPKPSKQTKGHRSQDPAAKCSPGACRLGFGRCAPFWFSGSRCWFGFGLLLGVWVFVLLVFGYFSIFCVRSTTLKTDPSFGGRRGHVRSRYTLVMRSLETSDTSTRVCFRCLRGF